MAITFPAGQYIPADFNKRVADLYSKTKGVDKTIKVLSKGAALVGNLTSHIPSAEPFARTCSALGATFSVVHSGFKILDAFQDISTPSGDQHNTNMSWVQLAAFTASDAFNPILFLEKQGFYTFDQATRDALSWTSAGLGIVGLVTGVVQTVYQMGKENEKLADINAHLAAPQPDDIPAALQLRKGLIEESLLQKTIKIAEKVIDIAAIIFGVLSFLCPIILLPIALFLGLAGAVLALIRLWRETGAVTDDQIQNFEHLCYSDQWRAEQARLTASTQQLQLTVDYWRRQAPMAVVPPVPAYAAQPPQPPQHGAAGVPVGQMYSTQQLQQTMDYWRRQGQLQVLPQP